MAEKELERRQREAEEERLRDERRAKHDRDMALLAAEKLAAVADAILIAIERSMEEEQERTRPLSRVGTPEDESHRTLAWVDQTTPTADKLNATSPEIPVTPGLERNCDGNTSVRTDLLTPMRSVPLERHKSNQYTPLSQAPKSNQYTPLSQTPN